jgi:hypothetical protein
MAWNFGGTVHFSKVFSSGFRNIAMGLAGLSLVAGGVIYVLGEIEERRSLKRIQVSELVFGNLLLTPLGSNFTLTGRVKNNSPTHTLTEISVAIKLKDCSFGSMSPEEWLASKSPNTSDDYSAWIAKNSEKRGTPEYETVAKAYELAKSAENSIRYAELARQFGGTISHPPAIASGATTKNLDNSCVIIGEIGHGLSLSVPPGQARDFEDLIGLQGQSIKPRGKFEWSYSAVEVRGK